MKRHLNLIPVATQRRQLLRRVVRVGSIAVVLSGATTGLLLTGEWAQGWIAAQQLNELDERAAPLRQIIDRQDALAKQVEALRARELLTLRLSRESHELTLLGAVAQAAGETSNTVYVQQLRYTRPPIQEDQSSSRGELQLTGAGIDGAAIARFASELRDTGVFSLVSVESTGSLPGGDASLRRYRLNCRL